MYKLMLVLMITDSGSYTFLLDPIDSAYNRKMFIIYHVIQKQAWIKFFEQAKFDDKLKHKLDSLGYFNAPKESLFPSVELILDTDQNEV